MSESRSRSSRRDFLKGKSAINAIGDLGRGMEADEKAKSANRQASADSTSRPNAGPADPLHPSDADQRSYLIEVGRRAMACSFEVFLNAGKHDLSTQIALEALDLVEKLEDQLTVYRNHSEVCEINAVAPRRPIFVETGLYGLLKSSLQLFADTHGAFDITSGPLIQTWGRLRREGHLPTDEELSAALERVGSQHVLLDDQNQSVRFLRPGVSINLGGIGKGFALDECAKLFQASRLGDFMIHGGSSSILARGTRQSGSDEHGWRVGVRHPSRSDRRLLEILLVDAAIGTSGAGTQQFYFQGKRYGHIIDPRSGRPAEGVLSTTVVAPDGAVADALSTAFYVLGIEAAEQYCEQHPEVSAIMTTPASGPDGLQLHFVNCDHLTIRKL